MAVKVLDLPCLGETATFRSERESALAYHGRWLTGPLEGKEATPSKPFTLEASPRAKKEKKRDEAPEGRRKRLLEALGRAAVPLDEWCRANGFDPRCLRSDIGALRRLGHSIRAVGAGRFALEVKA